MQRGLGCHSPGAIFIIAKPSRTRVHLRHLEIPTWKQGAGRQHRRPCAGRFLAFGAAGLRLWSLPGSRATPGRSWDVWSAHWVLGLICPQSQQHPCEAAHSQCSCSPGRGTETSRSLARVPREEGAESAGSCHGQTTCQAAHSGALGLGGHPGLAGTDLLPIPWPPGKMLRRLQLRLPAASQVKTGESQSSASDLRFASRRQNVG